MSDNANNQSEYMSSSEDSNRKYQPDIMALATGDFETFLKSIPEDALTEEDEKAQEEELKKIYVPVPDPESYPPEFVKIVGGTKMVRADIVAHRHFDNIQRRMAEKGKHFKDENPENPNQ